MWLADAAAMDCAVPMMHVPGEDDPYWEEMSQTPWWRMY
jgi:hypothetical protein